MTHTLTSSDLRRPPDALSLSATELLACWEALRLGQPPQRLRLARPGPEYPDVQHLFRTALTDLTRRGLATGSKPSSELATPLRLIAQSALQLDIRYTNPTGAHQPVIAVASLTPPRAVITMLPTDTSPMQLWTIDSARAATTLLGFLGNIRPGRGVPVNIPTGMFNQARRATTEHSLWALAEQLRSRGISATDASALAHMCQHASLAGQLGVTTRHHTGHATIERRGPYIIGFHRDHHGYYLQLRRAGTLTVAPIDLPRLHRHWQHLIDQPPMEPA